jgi:hypothetical protein
MGGRTSLSERNFPRNKKTGRVAAKASFPESRFRSCRRNKMVSTSSAGSASNKVVAGTAGLGGYVILAYRTEGPALCPLAFHSVQRPVHNPKKEHDLFLVMNQEFHLYEMSASNPSILFSFPSKAAKVQSFLKAKKFFQSLSKAFFFV